MLELQVVCLDQELELQLVIGFRNKNYNWVEYIIYHNDVRVKITFILFIVVKVQLGL